ncbi:MAG: methyl-accepting chemotaxis protein [Bacillota bacterium]|nr:methyl-accepting chemotaxis protein [Bacillota bacterium]
MKFKIILSVKNIFKLISKPFNNLKIKYKLIIGFTVIISLFIMAAYLTVSDMKKMNENSNAVYNESLIPIQLLSNLQSNVEYERRESIKMIIEKDKAEEHLKNVTDMISEDKGILSTYSEIAQSGQSKTAYEDFEKAYNSYSKSAINLIDEKNFEKIKKEVESIDLKGNEVITKLNTIIYIYKNEAVFQNKQNGTIFKSIISKVVYILIFTILFSILIVFSLVVLINNSILKVKNAAEAIAIGDVNIDMEKTERKDEIGELINAFASMTENIKQETLITKGIAKGDFDADINIKSDKDVLGIALSSTISTIKTIDADIIKVIENIENGNTSERINLEAYEGGWRELAERTNKLIDTFMAPINLTSDYIEKISSGNIPGEITEIYKGDFNKIKNNLNNCIYVLSGLISETMALTKSVQQGKLGIRGSVENYSGDWGRLVSEINNLIGAFKLPIDYAAQYLAFLGRGEDPGEVSDSFSGEFKVITENLGFVRNSFLELFTQTTELTKKAKEGSLSYRADTSNLNGAYLEIINGINQTLYEIIRPIEETSKVLEEVSKGNLNSKVMGEYNGDFAILKVSVNETVTSLKKMIVDIKSVLSEISKGNLRIAINEEYDGDFKEISDSFKTIVEFLNDTLRNIETACQQGAAGSIQVSDSSAALSEGASIQAGSIEEITASITEITAQIEENAVSASKANDMTLEAKKDLEESKTQMEDMMNAMEDISRSSLNIGKIIKLIDEIAFQTKMLSLNAAVEAARAGQNGKGFAVVAEEVRLLAQRSADAVNETSALIKESASKVEIGRKLASDTSKTLYKIAEEVSDITDLVGTITNSSKEQASGITQINEAIEEVSKVTQANTATSEESAAASRELSNLANLLSEKVSLFKL